MGCSIQDAIGVRDGFVLVGALEKTKPDADAILRRNTALLIGSTGQPSNLLARIQVTSSSLPIVRSGNFSFGLNLMLRLVEKASTVLLPGSWDVLRYVRCITDQTGSPVWHGPHVTPGSPSWPERSSCIGIG